jgi:hypothetical protein
LPEFQMSGIVGLGTSLHPVSVYCTFHRHCLIMEISHVTGRITAAHLGRSIFAWHPSQGPLFQTSMKSEIIWRFLYTMTIILAIFSETTLLFLDMARCMQAVSAFLSSTRLSSLYSHALWSTWRPESQDVGKCLGG